MNEANSKPRSSEPEVRFCDENRRLLEAYGDAVQVLTLLHEQQFAAIVDGDADSSRFDLLIHMATEKKHVAKYTYLKHMETHGC